VGGDFGGNPIKAKIADAEKARVFSLAQEWLN
jgi:hypothetical protein